MGPSVSRVRAKRSPKKISMPFRPVVLGRADRGDGRLHPEIRKKLLNGDGTQLRSDDAVTVVEQPVDVERLSAQRHEDAVAFRQREG
jgi:hypothetical protein